MKLFVDTSVLLAAAGSAKGASRFIFEQAEAHGWLLLTSAYCVEETDRNARKLGPKSTPYWRNILLPQLTLVPVELAYDQVLVFPKAKDRPVLLSALGAEADVFRNWATRARSSDTEFTEIGVLTQRRGGGEGGGAPTKDGNNTDADVVRVA